MRDLVAMAIGVYNLVQNYLVPRSAYVPTNLTVAAGLVWLARRSGCTWEELGLDRQANREGLRLGAAGAGVAVSLSAVAVLHPRMRRLLLDERARGQSTGEIVYNSTVRFPLGTALFEEIVFRGIVEGVWLNEGSSATASTLADAALFTAWHLVPTARVLGGSPAGDKLDTLLSRGAAVVGGALTTGIAALGFAWMRRSSGSVVAPWLTHAAFNTASYLAGVIAWRRSGSDRV